MPHRANDRIAVRIVSQGWFRSQSKEGLPSDNWRLVLDDGDRRALLYMVRFMTATGEPRRIPNNRQALPRLYLLDRGLPAPKAGPFIALAEVSDPSACPDVLGLWVWDLSAYLPAPWPTLKVNDLGRPLFQAGRKRPFQYPIQDATGAIAGQGPGDQEGIACDSDALRDLLRERFTAQDLRRLCRSCPRLQPLLRYWGPESEFGDMIDIAIEYGQKWALLPELLARAREFALAH